MQHEENHSNLTASQQQILNHTV